MAEGRHLTGAALALLVGLGNALSRMRRTATARDADGMAEGRHLTGAALALLVGLDSAPSRIRRTATARDTG